MVSGEQDPAEGLRKRIENIETTSAVKSELDREVISHFPVNAKEPPKVWVEGQNLKGTSDVGFRKPCITTYQMDKMNSMVYGGILYRKIRKGNYTVILGTEEP